MSTVVNVHEAKTRLSRLLERVENGEEIILARAGEPIARLVPLARTGQRRPGRLIGRVTESFFAPLPDDELRLWEGSSGSCSTPTPSFGGSSTAPSPQRPP